VGGLLRQAGAGQCDSDANAGAAMSTPRQHFIDRIARFRNNQFEFQTYDAKYAEEYEPILRRLCADDELLRKFHDLVDSLSDAQFARIMDRLIVAFGLRNDNLEMARFAKRDFVDIKRACDLIEELSTIPGALNASLSLRGTAVHPVEITRAYEILEKSAGGPPPDDALLVELNDCIQIRVFVDAKDCVEQIKIHLNEALLGLEQSYKSYSSSFSRKVATASQEAFMAFMADVMEEYFKKPHYEIVADLTYALYETEASADAVRKARDRTRERERKREQEREQED
jgi:hypothetical protein